MPLYLPPVTSQADPLDLATPDASAAPALYDQAQIASVVALANANKTKINAVLAALRGARVIQ